MANLLFFSLEGQMHSGICSAGPSAAALWILERAGLSAMSVLRKGSLWVVVWGVSLRHAVSVVKDTVMFSLDGRPSLTQ